MIPRRPEGGISAGARTLFYTGVGLAGVGFAGVASSYGVDGGALTFFWKGIQTASPLSATGAIIALVVVWSNWQRDRREHADRSIDYVQGMNSASRLREEDMREKRKLRDECRRLREEINRLRGRARR